MEVVSHLASATSRISNHFSVKVPPNVSPAPVVIFSFSHFPNKKSHFNPHSFPSSSFSSIFCSFSTPASVNSAPSRSPPTSSLPSISADNNLWMVLMASPPVGIDSKPQVIDYYVKTLQKVLNSEKEAQMCMYDASWENHFGFCCHIDEQTSRELAQLSEVLLVKPDTDFNSIEKDYSSIRTPSSSLQNPQCHGNLLFPSGKTKQWLVQVDQPNVGIVTKAQMVDFYAQLLSKVLGNEKDAQMCIYHVSWQSNFGFCCELDENCARELAGVPGVLSVQPDRNFESEMKDYQGNNLRGFMDSMNSSEATLAPVKTKKLFITGLSFYTSEKTLRAAFEGFGELVEVKIIMDKISKRSKGYAFLEYTTEEAASAALKEMNGKIINGWMIVVDVAKPTPSKSSRRSGRPAGLLLDREI